MKAPMRLRRRQFRGAHAKAKVIRQTRTKREERPVNALSRQGSVWERTVTATVVVMGDGDGRIHGTNMDTGRRRMGMGNLSRDRRPSRTSLAGPAAPLQRPCASTNTLSGRAIVLVQHRALLEPMFNCSHSSYPINNDGSTTTTV